MYIYANQAFYAFLTSLACARDFCNHRQDWPPVAAKKERKSVARRAAARRATLFLGVGNRFIDY